jgi:hypothetical protein
MILVSDAGSTRSSGFSVTRIWALDRSPRTHACAPIAGGCGAAASTNVGSQARKTSAVLVITLR